MTQRVAYDNAPTNLPSPREHRAVRRGAPHVRRRLQVPAGERPSAGVGFSRLSEERTHRIFESTTDNMLRLIVRLGRQPLVTLRTKYEHAQRRGEGFDRGRARSCGDRRTARHAPLRHRAARPRSRDHPRPRHGHSNVSLNASLAAGKDDYAQLPPQLAGEPLRAARQLTSGVLRRPRCVPDRVSSRSAPRTRYERYNALSRSRQANPRTEFEDPTRNWATEGTDRAHSVILTAGFERIADKIAIDVAFDYNRARALYGTWPAPCRIGRCPKKRSSRPRCRRRPDCRSSRATLRGVP